MRCGGNYTYEGLRLGRLHAVAGLGIGEPGFFKQRPPRRHTGGKGEMTCNARVVEHADWGDIAAVVQSARLCLRRGDGRQWSERAPIYVGFGLAQHGGARLTGTLAVRALAEKRHKARPLP